MVIQLRSWHLHAHWLSEVLRHGDQAGAVDGRAVGSEEEILLLRPGVSAPVIWRVRRMATGQARSALRSRRLAERVGVPKRRPARR
eukprot:349903-Chlamydomonas_euryale.AAC.4